MSDSADTATATASAVSGFLGTGWAFPPSFGAGGATMSMVSDVEDIQQSLQILFATRQGERPMHEDYGCRLDELMFAPVDQALVNSLVAMIDDAVLRHEPRITLQDVDVTPDGVAPGVLRIRLDYLVRATHTRFNMVFPFYLNDATTGQG